MDKYDHNGIESKWQKSWADSELYKTREDKDKPKCYVLDMFPYPSGEGLHVGHPKGYIATDIYSRFKQMTGHNILHPMGWDAFGLPAEQFAIKNKVHPRIAVDKNTKRYKEQLSVLGFNYDWDKEINTTDPEYYKWTQWTFLKMLERGLAYESHEPINWCPSCQTGLANEDLEGSVCERCDTEVVKKPMRQWVLKITDYADRMLEDLDELNWPNSIKESQRNWIGRSEGAEIEFKIKTAPQGRTSSVASSSSRNDLFPQFKIFTTRPDTLYGATYCVLAPEHGLVDELKDKIENWDEVEKYREEVSKKTEIERTAEGKEKTGVELKGVKVINPANGEELPIFIADYVLAHYGTGAIMAVPAHDERDFEFANKFNISIVEVISGGGIKEEAHTNKGILINSGKFDGMDSEEAKTAITEFVGGKMKTTYKLRDWVFSRQRYWGEPIPVIHCEKCGTVPVPEKDLPVLLPDVESYEPTGTGESPLAGIEEWVNVDCPKCDGAGKRETNTMPQWAGSSWYYLRYIDPKNKEALVDKEKEKYWMGCQLAAPKPCVGGVDMYVGGAEHATRHLIYARFWHKFLYDIGVVNYKEPFSRLQYVGLIAAEDGRKMSKRYGNVINPDDIVATYGADTLRLYEMFMGPFDQGVQWSTDSIIGPRRFIEKIWNYVDGWKIFTEDGKVVKDFKNKEIELLLHKTIKKVTEDIESFNFNTAISAMMILMNKIREEIDDPSENRIITKHQLEVFLKLLAPFVPHVAEELWHRLGNKTSVHLEEWPKYDDAKTVDDTVTIAVQVNGKVRGTLEIAPDTPEEDVKKRALESDMAKKWIGDSSVEKIVYVSGRLISIVTKG